MKKPVLFFLLFAACLSCAMAQDNAMYVYRNDGEINAFLKSDVDSIVYSQIDVDSLVHGEYVVQEVWTVDSVYRIPLAVIDSVSFVTPKTVYKSDVIKLSDNLIDYVIGAENQTLMLKANTPVLLLPLAGDKVVLLESCEALPYGFAGEVKSVNVADDRIEVVCTQVYIEDIFESFCSVQTLLGYADEDADSTSNSTRAVYNPDDRTLKLRPETISASKELSQGVKPDGDLALKGGISGSVTLEPTFRIHTFLIVGEGQGLYFQSSITGSLSVSTKTSVYGGINWTRDFPGIEIKYPIPQTAGFVNFYINPGLFIRADAVVTSSINATRNYTFGMAFDYSSIGERVVRPSIGGRLASQTTDMEGSIDGSFAFGAYLETGFSLLSRELSKVCVRGEAGMQVSGNFVLRNSDIDNAEENTELYEKLKASSIEYGPFVNVSLNASVLDTLTEVGHSWQLSETWGKWDLVPTFSETTVEKDASERTAKLSCRPSRNVLLPLTLGYGLYDKEGILLECQMENDTYKQDDSGYVLEKTFTELKRNKTYEARPMIQFMGNNIPATPVKEFSLECSVTTGGVTNVEETNATCSGMAELPNEYTLCSYGICYSAYSSTPTIDNSTVLEASGGENFSVALSGLKENTYYYYRAYLVVDDNRYYGEVRSFTTKEEQKEQPQITNFEITGSDYSKGAFSNEGRTYDYRFNAATTVEIESLDGVADWGYVYKDPYGNIKRISLMAYGTSYTDTRYAYYRNEAKSTACLYGYVKYEGDDSYYDGEPQFYPLEYSNHSCPDDNHPHLIDLGLPSGTKWACCNVGASSPSDYGSYFAWGETSPKSEYTWETYKYGSDYYELTKYDYGTVDNKTVLEPSDDAATANWGSGWRMPTRQEIEELSTNCTWTWTTLNGVNGQLVTGPNGNSIFLPAAGGRWVTSLDSAGSLGWYWSSSLYTDYPISAYYLYFNSDFHYWYDSTRDYGHSVRPVRASAQN